MKDQSVERILEHCLRDMACTGDGEAALRRHAQQADELRPLLALAEVVSEYYTDVPQPPQGLAEGRRRLLEAVAQHRAHSRSTRSPTSRVERKPNMKLALLTKLASAALAAVMGALAIGGGVAMAAADSLPGDALYPVKLTVEDIRLDIASSPQTQADLALQFAHERAQEMQRLMQQGETVPEEVVARMEQHVHRAMSRAAWASEEEMPGLLQRIAQRLQQQTQTLEQLRTAARQQNQIQVQNALQVCQQAHQEATEGLADPQAFRARYQHRHNMPEDVSPPEPPSNDPQGEGGEGPQQEPGGPNTSPGGPSQGGQQGEGTEEPEQERLRQQQQNQQQEQQQEQQQQQEQDGEQERIQNQTGPGGPNGPDGGSSSQDGGGGGSTKENGKGK